MKNNIPSKILIDGIDRIGKSSLIKAIKQSQGYYMNIHLSKPEQLDCLGNSLEVYQKNVYNTFFDMLKSDAKLLFDRTHISENIYAPLYRKYDGSYIFELEAQYYKNTNQDVKLVLLYTTDFSILEDDGLSFDFNKKEEEQAIFLASFDKSVLPKVKVDVADGNGGYKTRELILKEIFGG